MLGNESSSSSFKTDPSMKDYDYEESLYLSPIHSYRDNNYDVATMIPPTLLKRASRHKNRPNSIHSIKSKGKNIRNQ